MAESDDSLALAAEGARNENTLRFLKSGARGLYIGGRFVPSLSGKTFETINPANERRLAMVAEGGEADIDAAVAAARKAFDHGPWPRMRPADRAKVLYRLADIVQAHTEELAELDTLDSGLMISVTRPAAQGIPDALREAASWANKVQGETYPTGTDHFSFSLREPVGVCGIIIPWNGPAVLAARKPAIALACGNTVIVKPAEQTPLSALRLAELISEAGFPEGVINIVTGFGLGAGSALANHPGVDAMSFTGSAAVGQEIVRGSAINFKKVMLELGGKSPHVIFADADLERAVPNAALGVFRNHGQMCFAGSRILVQREIYPEFAAALAKFAADMKVASPWDPDAKIGPLVSAAQFERVTGYIDLGVREGARLSAGGRLDGGKGYYVRPTVFSDVENRMRIAQEEIFGPVASLIPFDTEEEAVAKGNDTVYGLGAGIWTRDVGRAIRMSRQLRAGHVWINGYGLRNEMAPFGGFKHSGIGREGGKYSVEFYSEMKSVFISV